MKKIYGQSKKENCYFCSKSAITLTCQGVPSCLSHKENVVKNKRCVCGFDMQVQKGKFGPFFLCQNCGPKSFEKAQNMDTNGFKLNKRYRD